MDQFYIDEYEVKFSLNFLLSPHSNECYYHKMHIA